MSKFPSDRVTDNRLQFALKMNDVQAAQNIQAAHYLKTTIRYQQPKNPIDSSLDLLALIAVGAIIIAALSAILS